MQFADLRGSARAVDRSGQNYIAALAVAAVLTK
jgi:hypothetical protein